MSDTDESKVSDLGGYIRAQRKTAELSLRNLAKLAGVSNPYLSQIERGLRKPSAEILQAIARALSISSETLYVKAGILDERDIEPGVEDAISRDVRLSEPQRKALIEMHRSFVRVNELEATDADTDADDRAGGPIRGLIDAVSTGDVDDDDVASTVLDAEDAEEA